MKRLAVAGVTLLCLIGLCSCGSGFSAGDTPALSFTAIDGRQVDLSQLRGKLVLVDFWATWCGPCMAEADHMVRTNQQYGPRGLVIVGISLDGDRSRLEQVAREKGFTWPQYFDGQVWKNRIAQTWGVDSIPRTFLIGPDGQILWTGHPAEMDPAIERAFKNHPPRA